MSQPRDYRQDELFRPPLEEIINFRHSLVRLAGEIDWDFLARRFSSVCRVGPGQPPLPTRLVAGLFILKHMHNLSDEALCERWVENPYFQYFCGEVVFLHELPFDRSSFTRWRQRLGEEQIAALLRLGKAFGKCKVGDGRVEHMLPSAHRVWIFRTLRAMPAKKARMASGTRLSARAKATADAASLRKKLCRYALVTSSAQPLLCCKDACPPRDSLSR